MCGGLSGSAAPLRKWNDRVRVLRERRVSLIAPDVTVAWKAPNMAFGQQSGPPATAKQVEEITALLEGAGFSSLREARHIYGLTQRQAGGKFTRSEADELLARLLAGDGELDVEQAAQVMANNSDAAERAAKRQSNRQAEMVASLPDELLADELVRRGWVCIPGD